MDKKTLRKADLVMSILLILFAVFVFVMSLQLIDRTLNLKNQDNAVLYRSAGLIPMVVSILLAISAISLFITAWKDGARFDFFTKEKVKHFFTCREFRIASFVIGWMAVYIFILLGPIEDLVRKWLKMIPNVHWMIPEYMPYILMTFAYLGIFIMTFSNKKSKKEWIVGLSIALIVSFLVAYLFGEVAMVRLP